jgi:hypothetical protein
VWALDSDAPLARDILPDVRDLLATPTGCLALAGDRAVWLQSGSLPQTLAEKVTAIAGDASGLLAARGDQVVSFDPAGVLRATETGERDITALAVLEGRLILGNARGGVRVLAPAQPGNTRLPGFTLVDTPPSQAVRIAAGPMATVVIGFANGQLGIWDLVHGERLYAARLHGAVTHLARSGRQLWAASELGDHLGLDLGVFEQDRCSLLREVWREVATVWANGRPALEPPPGEHPCLAAGGSPAAWLRQLLGPVFAPP